VGRSRRSHLAAGWLAAAAALAAALAGHSGLAAPALPAPVQVRAKEFAFDPRELVLPPGELTFQVKNDGAIEHNFAIEDGAGKALGQIPIIAPGATETLRVTLRPGRLAMVCTLPGHREAGMHGTITVRL